MTTEKNKSRNQIICIALFIVYAVLTLIGAAKHEIWYDEAQAWTIARDNTIGGIFEQLRYEGHPPLWYLILFIFAHLGFSCDVIPFISWFFTGLAAAVVMFKSPFSTITKALLLFSGGFLFFNSVMSRTYCLINLLLVLIAVLFSKRKEHPVIFGTLVALLANTHICVSGFIGAMGLIMLHDIYNDWKTNTSRKNVLNLTGLAIAGIGVLMLIIPLIGSLNSNSITSGGNITVKSCLTAISESFFKISYMLLGAYIRSEYLLSGILSVIFIILLILIRHKIRPLITLILSVIFYIISSEIIWFANPHRVHTFVMFFVIAIWIAEDEPQNKCSEIWKKLNLNGSSKLITKLVTAIKNCDINFKSTYIKCLSVILLLSMPVGVSYLVKDYTNSFSVGKEIAEYVKENLPSDSVFVITDTMQSQIAAYLPGYKFYSIEEQQFTTYSSHSKPESISYSKIYNDLKDCPHLYQINVFIDIDALESNRDIVYKIRDGINFGTNARYVEISTLDAEKELKP